MREWIEQIFTQYGYWGVFALIAVENLFPPIPSEVILTLGGFLTTVTALTYPGVVASATAGSCGGAVILYAVGRLASPQRLGAFFNSRAARMLHIEREDVEKTADWFARRGTLCVLYGRCIPIIRSLVSVPAGMSGMAFAPFFGMTVLGSLAWNLALVGAGAALGTSWPVAARALEQVSGAVKLALWAAALLACAAWVRRNWKRKGKQHGNVRQESGPLGQRGAG